MRVHSYLYLCTYRISLEVTAVAPVLSSVTVAGPPASFKGATAWHVTFTVKISKKKIVYLKNAVLYSVS